MATQTRTEILPASAGRPEVEVVRSARRRRTVSARMLEDGRVRLLVPAVASRAEVEEYLGQLLPQILRQQEQKQKRRQKFSSDDYLVTRAEALIGRYLPNLPLPETIRWVTNQNSRWGSATPAQGSIRISHQIQGAPDYVVDFVLYHELCHFLEINHNARFRALESRFERKAEAEAFLAGLSFGQKKTS